MIRHKVILYNPQAVFYTMPLALIAVASGLDPERYDVRIIDARIEKNGRRRLVNESKDALCVGMSVLTGRPIHDALLASRAVKKAHPGVSVIWGGWHPSLFPMDILKEKSVDITVQGQGEVTFGELVERLANRENLKGLQGISYKTTASVSPLKEEFCGNPPRAMTDMNSFPYQRYELIDVERYYQFKKQRQFDYISSAGCYFRCTFCADPFVYNRKWTAIRPDRMAKEIEVLWKLYKFDELSFQDETFFTYRKRVVRIAEEFLRRGLKFKWNATMRADQGYRLGEDVFKLLVKSGLRSVLIGVESGMQGMLSWMKKDITIEQILYCAELCRKFGIYVTFPSIVGFPDETDESVYATLELAKKLRLMSPRFETPIFYFKPYPGSEITLDIVRKGYRLPGTLEEWAEFDFIGSSGPWVNEDKFKKIERFKFYNRFAGGPETLFRFPLQKLSRWRLNKDFLNIPVEKYVVEFLKPQPRLS